MTAHTVEFFTLDEVNRLKIIQEVIDRECRRLLARYPEYGPLGMTNRRRGKSSNNQLPPGLAAYALNIIRESYNDFGPTLACEKLSEVHGIHLLKETVRKLMTQTSLWVPRKQRVPKIPQPRYRQACVGELLQIDGCDHHWCEARKVSKSLTVQYDKVLYLIEDSEFGRRSIGKYIDVWHYPDGHKELRLNGVSLPYSTYDKISEIDLRLKRKQ